MSFLRFIALILLFTGLVHAAGTTSDTAAFRDTKEYINAIEKMGKLKIDDQVDAWQTFLSDHPKTIFRKEIEKNIEYLEGLSQKKSGSKKGDERDAELYLKALEFSKKLKIDDQILLWQQFLDENPTSIYRNDAQIRLYKLKRTRGPVTKPAPTVKPASPSSLAPATTPPAKTAVLNRKPIKDPDQAMLLASLAGLAVPGMGHWYTEDYLIAGVLTAIRLGGFGIAIPGIINSEYEKIYIGGGLAVLSYAIDIADAPFSAERYNDKHMQTFFFPEKVRGTTIPLFAFSTRF